MYKEKVIISSNDVDKHLNLKVSSFFKYFQMVSTKHSETIGVGTGETIDKGMCWVIVRMRVKIYEYPKMKEEVIVTTHPGEVNRFIYPRFYELYDKKGHLLASSSTIWVVIDMNSRRVLTKPFGDRIFKSEVCKDDIPLPEKIRHGELEKIEERKIRNSDIDLNGHLNNSRYIDFIIDTFEQGFFDDKVVSDILVNYEKELKEGDYVELFVDKKENIVEGKHDGKECFTAQLEFRNI